MRITFLTADSKNGFFANIADAVVDAGTDKVILFLYATGENACFGLFAFIVSNSEVDGWTFMLIDYGNAPSILGADTATNLLLNV